MKMIPILFILMAFLPEAAADSARAEHKIPAVWSAEPIPDADPEQRHAVLFKVPTTLLLDLASDGTSVGFDSVSAAAITVQVGRRMAVGLDYELYYLDQAERVPLLRGMTSPPESLLGSGRSFVQGLDEILETQDSLQLIAELVVFETDIPARPVFG